MMKRLILVLLLILFNNVNSSPRQEGFNEILQKMQVTHSNECETKYFSPFFPEYAGIFQNLNFNIKNLTAIDKTEPTKRPGLTPDWGTGIFEKMIFENLVFKDCNFKWLNFSGAQFNHVKFIRCQLEGAVFDGSKFKNVVFEQCNLKDSSFFKSNLELVTFSENNLRFSSFVEASFQNVSYLSNNLCGCIFLTIFNQSNSLFFEGCTKHIVFNDTFISKTRKPVILISWDNKKPALAASKIVKKIQKLGGIPLKFNYQDPDIDPIKLKNEVDLILRQIDLSKEQSIPKKILEIAEIGNYPEIGKITKKTKAWLQVVSGVLIPGGIDVQPLFYNQIPHPKTNLTNDLRRDLFEFAILDELEPNKKPILAICRGMQVVNVWFGGTLNQHVEGHLYCSQKYCLIEHPKSHLKKIFSLTDEPFVGFSYHHQTVDKIGKGLTPTVTSQDGTIKALEMLNHPFAVFVQWHPEFKGDQSTPEAIELDAKLSIGNHEIYKSFLEAASR